MPTMYVDVAVIGAGVSGLRAAHTLRHRRPDLSAVVLEASREHIGGRMRTLQDHAALAPLHLGAELVHGTNTSLARMVGGLGF
jgi:protoporphyrinogen oxidase